MHIPITLSPIDIVGAVVGGILPTLIWLWFFLKEDARKPEPRLLILLVFLAGMMSVMVAYPLEVGVAKIAETLGWENSTMWWALLIPILCFAFIEELTKFAAARFTALRTVFFDEPIDAMIYLITAALGFAAMENFFYLLANLSQITSIQQPLFVLATGEPTMFGNFFSSVTSYLAPYQGALVNAQLRFVGATLLHVVTSATIGFSIALAYYSCPDRKRLYLGIGILTAVALHLLFNLLIMRAQDNASEVFKVFEYFWLLAIGIIFLFERAKMLKKTNNLVC